MRKIEYEKYQNKYLNKDIRNMLNKVHEYKGKTGILLDVKKDMLSTLIEIAKIQSIDSSNRIEGIFTSNKRLIELVNKKSKPINRNEEEILGYREALKIVHESYEYVDISPSYILQLHKELYGFSQKSIGGHFKSSDNLITEIDSAGKERIRFEPVKAFQTPTYIEDLCKEYNKAKKDDTIEGLILIPIFIVDFLCIHPFIDGNGRMSRLLTLLLLYKHDYTIGKYISIEKMIEKTKESYYETLQDASTNWHENKNTYEPFIRYFLGIILKAYDGLENRINDVGSKKVTKAERITSIALSKPGKFTKKDILEECYDISKITVERTLNNLLKQNKIIKHSNGANAFYTTNFNNK